MVFTGAKAATEYCRSLAREFGFTIKQETSSNKVIPKALSYSISFLLTLENLFMATPNWYIKLPNYHSRSKCEIAIFGNSRFPPPPPSSFPRSLQLLEDLNWVEKGGKASSC